MTNRAVHRDKINSGPQAVFYSSVGGGKAVSQEYLAVVLSSFSRKYKKSTVKVLFPRIQQFSFLEGTSRRREEGIR